MSRGSCGWSMRSPHSLAFSGWLVLLALASLASAAIPGIPSPQGEVTDLVGVLDAGARQQLTQLIREVRDRTTAEIAILIVPSTAPETVEEYSVAVFDRWKIGQRGKDNGLLFLVAIQDRRLWITTGYGLEGILPDGKVGALRDREIIPLFRAGRYTEGILRGTQALAAVVLGQAGEVPLNRHFAGVHRQPGDRAGKAGLGRDIDKQIVDRLRADHAQHRAAFGRSQREVTHGIS